jgi:hypothetical protein
MRRRRRLPRTPLAAINKSSPTQRHSMRMRSVAGLAPVDLPVDSVVVLEQQERAGETERIECALLEG